MGCCLSLGVQQPPSTSMTSSALAHDLPVPAASDPSPECEEQEQGKEETIGSGDQLQHVSSPPGPADGNKEVVISSTECTGKEQGEEEIHHVPSSSCSMGESEEVVMTTVGYAEKGKGKEGTTGPEDQLYHVPASSGSTDEDEEIVIATIRATDVALGLARLPAGFYIAVYHSGLEWRTENKRSSVNDDVEWSGPIPIPSDLSVTIRLEVYASFEFHPMLGTGEELRQLTLTVEQLMDCSARDVAFSFCPKEGDVVSPCSAILITIKRQKHNNDGSSAPRILDPHWSISESLAELEAATNNGHGALLRYQKHGDRRDLEHSIEQFENALDRCPMVDHPCRAAAQCNLAMAKLILCQVDSDASLEDPLRLYRSALATRPVGHPDRPSTLIHLAAVHFAQFQKRRGDIDIEEAQFEALLHEEMALKSAEGCEKRAATFMHQLLGGCRVDPVESNEQDLTSGLSDEDLEILSAQLLGRFDRFGDLADLQQAIPLLKELAKSTPSWDDRYPGRLQNLGTALHYRFRCLGELMDLGAAISMLRDAVDYTPRGHPSRSARLSNLGVSLSVRFEHLGELCDLEDAISTLRDAVDLTPHDTRCLNNLGTFFRVRFERLGQLSDLDYANSTLRDAVNLAPQTPMYLSNLGNSLRSRFESLGKLDDLDDAISKQREAVELTPPDHPEKPDLLNNLGVSLLVRFERLQQLNDLEDAISSLKGAVNLTPHGHPDGPNRLANLGMSFSSRFGRLGQLGDLEDAVSTLRDALDLTPLDHPFRHRCLYHLGMSFQARFERLGKIDDLENAVLVLRSALDLIPNTHSHQLAYLSELGKSLRTRFEQFGQLADLEDAISTQWDAVNLIPHDHPFRPSYLHRLGTSLKLRFDRLGKLSDLEDAVLMLRGALDLIPNDHPGRSSCLNTLGNSLRTRFERLGQLPDLEDAISRQMDAVDLTPYDHPDKSVRLHNLGNSLQIRFDRLGQLSDLEDAISRQRDAIELAPDGYPDTPACLTNLGNSLASRFDSLGQLSDLVDAISKHKEAVELTPHDHHDKPICLSNLGISLLTSFERLGQLNDLEDAIAMFRRAVDITPDDHPAKPDRLSNLGASIFSRFKRLGQLSDLEDAISRQREAVNLTPHDHPGYPDYLNNLGNSLTTRFDRLGLLADLEDAISEQRKVLEITPHDYPGKSDRLSNLGVCLFARFKHLKQSNDLEDAISMFKEADDLTPSVHSHKPARLNNLGISFMRRFVHFGLPADLENGISMLREAADLTPQSHSDKPSQLYNLGISLEDRFEHLGQPSDLEDAISVYLDAIKLTPHDHPYRPVYFNRLGRTLQTRCEHLGELSYLEQVISLYSHAASAPIGPARVRFDASRNWISCAHRIHHHTLLHAYSVALSLLPQLAWTGLSLTHRFDELSRGANVVREAAAAALELGHPETAVEWLEQGRSIVWGELLQLRSSHEELSSAHPDHARRLDELSAALDHAGADHERLLSVFPEQTQGITHHSTESSQKVADRHRALAIERDKLLQEIRCLPGFEQFLLRKQFSQLRAAAHSGPVVLLNAAEARCDALIIIDGVDHVIHVPLPVFTFRRSADLQITLKHFVRHTREGRPVPEDRASWESILPPLWRGIVKPVLEALALSTPGDLSRIFWCPTGPLVFLPIHAAGIYDAQYSQLGNKVFDFVVSSYVPTLSILLGLSNPDPPPRTSLQLLAVRQPHSDGLFQLPGVVVELKHIKEVIRNSPSAHTTLVESSVGTVDEVLSLMKEADWVHFACHGIQDDVDSGLCLADRRRLKLRDMTALSRPRGGLAFLSACQTATGDNRLSDEAIHMAAGMLFAGYGGVVGTMWSISDKLAPVVARDVYLRLFGKGTRPDYREAAYALHEAVASLRDDGEPFVEWVPFIHVGL